MSSEKSTDLQEVGEFVKTVFIQHAEKTGNEYKLEIEPGTYLSANCGTLIAEVDDVVDTGENGYDFLKLNTGMDTITRPALYGSEHPIIILNDSENTKDYVICGHCCESGDVFTVDDSDTILPRTVKEAQIGDLVVIEGSWRLLRRHVPEELQFLSQPPLSFFSTTTAPSKPSSAKKHSTPCSAKKSSQIFA